MSEVKFNDQGKVEKHIDYWDSMTQLIVHLPYVGSLVKAFLKGIFKFKVDFDFNITDYNTRARYRQRKSYITVVQNFDIYIHKDIQNMYT